MAHFPPRAGFGLAVEFQAGAGEGGKAFAQTKAFADFFAQTRHWELEPYFDVDGARVWGATAMVLAEFLALVDDLDAAAGEP